MSGMKVRTGNCIQARSRTDTGGIVCCAKDKLWCPVVPGANVADVGLSSYQDFGTSKVAQFENPGRRIEQKILWLDISMTDSNGVYVGQRAEELVHV